jgi:YaiO family outer membrane protein
VTRAVVISLLISALGGFASGADYDTLTYESGITSVKQYMTSKEFGKAEALLKAMAALYPDNREIMSVLSSVQFWQGKYDESIETYQNLLNLTDDDSVRAAIEKVVVAKLLHDTDSLVAEGKTDDARKVLEVLFEGGKEPYESGYRLGMLYIRDKEYDSAIGLFTKMTEFYPDNREVLTMLAYVLFWQGKYDESIEVYQSILELADDDSVRKEIEKVVVAKLLHDTDSLVAEGKTGDARKVLEVLFEGGKEPYESGYRLGMLYIRERKYEKAKELFQQLKMLYPEDSGFIALSIESFILNGDIAEAQKELYFLTGDMREALVQEREDLFYRVKRNYLRVSGGIFNYSGDYKTERDFLIDIAQRIHEFTFVFHGALINRYGLQNSQVGLDIYSKLGERTKRWGYVSVFVSPDATFLPKLSWGGEIYQGYKDYEFSIGYRRMNFKEVSADIFIPGVTYYMPNGLSINERLYYVPTNGSLSLLSTLHFEPNHRFRGFYSMGIGQSSERVGSIQDLRKVFTFSNRLGTEYRYAPSVSIGAEASYEYRKDFYTTYGMILFSRYWW